MGVAQTHVRLGVQALGTGASPSLAGVRRRVACSGVARDRGRLRYGQWRIGVEWATLTELHVPVLLEETVVSLALRPDAVVVDATFGRGGHTRALLGRIGPGARILALDRDPAAVRAGLALAAQEPRLVPASL